MGIQWAISAKHC